MQAAPKFLIKFSCTFHYNYSSFEESTATSITFFQVSIVGLEQFEDICMKFLKSAIVKKLGDHMKCRELSALEQGAFESISNYLYCS